MGCVRAPRPDAVRACGLVAFAYVAASTCCTWKKIVASLIVVNGLLCHLTQTRSCFLLDVVVNVLVTIFINTTSPDQPYPLLAMLLMLLVWRHSSGHPDRAWLHVLGVQWVGAYFVARA